LTRREIWRIELIDSVEDGVAGVQLDGGLDSLTGGSSGSNSSNGSNWSSSIGTSKGVKGDSSISSSKGESSTKRESSVGASDGWDSGVNLGNDVSGGSGKESRATKSTDSGGSGKESRATKSTESIRIRESGEDLLGLFFLSLTPLSLSSRLLSSLFDGFLLGGGSGGFSSGKSSSMCFFSSLNLSSVLRGYREGKVENWSSKGSNNWDSRCDGKVGSRNSESVEGVGNILVRLELTVGINVLVTSGGDTESVPGLSAGHGTSGVTERELSELILSMELR